MDETEKVQLASLENDAALTRSEQALLRCRRARALEDTGDYEAARELLSPFWQMGERPDLSDLDGEAAGELLLRAGTLTGWLGNLKKIDGAQELAKDLIGESQSRFEGLGQDDKASEAVIELAYCYWREGAYDEARVLLQQSVARLGDGHGELKLVALLRQALVESSATRFSDSLRILLAAAPDFDATSNQNLKGRFHNELAYNLQSLGSSENRTDYTDRALVEFTAASFHFEQAGHTRYRAHVENNLGLLFYTLGRFAEAHDHLDKARKLYPDVENAVYAAIVDETRARVFLAQGLLERAEETARGACEVFEKAGELAQLAEAMTTHGIALARHGRAEQSLVTLERAAAIAQQAGNIENAGLALLAVIEEVAEQLDVEELREHYQRADELLARSQHPETLARLRQAARRVLTFQAQPSGASFKWAEYPREDRLAALQVLIADSQQRQNKQITFTPAALEAMDRFFLRDEIERLWSIVEETMVAAATGMSITAEAVETVALRGQKPRGNFAEPWADFSLKGELREPEKRFIELALRAAEGRISLAARLLGFNHNELLTSIIKSRYPELLAVRTPTQPRRRSIIRKPKR